jgi:hypothetical protein
MKRRLATMCFVTMFLFGLTVPSINAQTKASSPPTTKGIRALSVLVEELPSGAKAMGLTVEAIQTDVELKLRLAGIRVVTGGGSFELPGQPFLYVRVTVTDSVGAASIEVELDQNVLLERNNLLVFGVGTWRRATLLSSPNARFIRDTVKDLIDEFLND